MRIQILILGFKGLMNKTGRTRSMDYDQEDKKTITTTSKQKWKIIMLFDCHTMEVLDVAWFNLFVIRDTILDRLVSITDWV